MQSQHCLHYAHKFMNPSSIPSPSPLHEILKESLLVLACYGHVLTETTVFMSVSTLNSGTEALNKALKYTIDTALL